MHDWFKTGTMSPTLDGPTGLRFNHRRQGGCNYFAQEGFQPERQKRSLVSPQDTRIKKDTMHNKKKKQGNKKHFL